MTAKIKKRRIGAILLLTLLLTANTLLFSGCGLLDQAADVFYDGLGTLVVGRDEEAEAVSEDRYGYQCLGEEARKVYDQIVAVIQEQEEKTVVSTRDEGVLEQAFSAVLADYGEFFWISGYQYNTYTSGDRVIGLEVMPVYTMSKEERQEAQQQAETVALEWLQGLPEEAGDYEKSKYVFETLIDQVEYAEGAEESQNILSVFLHRQTVCQGYAEAAAYLLQKLGVQAAVVTGSANNEPHAWNLIRLDGEYYYMDVTWGNSKYLTGDAQEKKITNYAYLNMTTEDLCKTHKIEAEIPVPLCSAVADNYYRREGYYFEQWNAEEIGTVFQRAWDAGEKTATVRFADAMLYDRAVSYFIEDYNLLSFCKGMGSIHYVEDPDLLVLTLQF